MFKETLLGLAQAGTIYLLLVIVLVIMKKANIDKTKLMIIASIRMTVQLIFVGFLLNFIFSNPKPIYTVLFLTVMIIFAINRTVSTQKDLNLKFKVTIGISFCFSVLFVLLYFILAVSKENIFNPQYTIPIAGMIIGNSMTGITLGLKTFVSDIKKERKKIDTLINLGVLPNEILRPFVFDALETALLPTINSMMGMGIVFLPGMMTGQILSGALPTTAIIYQISIMIAICTSVCLTIFSSLGMGCKTLYNEKNQMNI